MTSPTPRPTPPTPPFPPPGPWGPKYGVLGAPSIARAELLAGPPQPCGYCDADLTGAAEAANVPVIYIGAWS